MDPTVAVAERVRAGKPTLVVGADLDLPPGTTAVRVRCDGPRGAESPLERARARIEALLDGPLSLGRARERIATSVRRRLLTDLPWRPADVRFVDACNRLAAVAPGASALVLDGIDGASGETLDALTRILREEGWLRLPVVLVSRTAPDGALAALAGTMRARDAGAIVQTAAPATRGQPDGARAPVLDALPADVLRVLRASAVVGCTFESDYVAELLGVSVEEVLEAAQRARDLGVPIEDRGDGVLALPEDVAEALSASVLPSLRARWHERLGDLLGAERAAEAEVPPHGPARARARGGAPGREGVGAPDPLRAAEYLASAGRTSASIESRLEAVADLTRKGNPARAAGLLEGVLADLEQAPAGPARQRVRARAVLERARLRWLGGGLEPSFTLGGALDEALAARAMLGPDAEAALRADVAATIAGIAYDLGDAKAVARAEQELTETVGALLQEGAALDAARLRNDQAALHLRRGDAELALRLLEQSLLLFQGRLAEEPGDANARAELADTHHLIARAALRTGAPALLAQAEAHALDAERTYRALGLRRDLARAWETLGRLAARRGDRAGARDRLVAAMKLEDASADFTGLARSTAALAEILAAEGSGAEALDLLGSSIELNREKGSPYGIASDARTLERVARALAASKEARANDELRDLLARTTSRLEAAARDLRRPGGPDAAPGAEP